MSTRELAAVWVFCGVLVLSSYFAFAIQHAEAQDIRTSAGDTFRRPNGLNRLHGSDGRQQLQDGRLQLQDQNELNRQHLTSMGKPCIATEPYATPQLINKKIYEHWIKASNSCGQNIKIQVCYRKTTDCIVMTLPPWETKNAVLGIQPNLKEFQYDAKEK
jgi:hypothetical protein